MHVDIDRFATLDSPVHRWDVRARLASLLILTFGIASTRTLASAAIAFAVAVALNLAARIPPRAIWQRGRWTLLILGPLVIVLPIVGAEGMSRADLSRLAATFLCRGAAIVILTLPLFSTARIADTMAGLRALRFPSRLATLFLFAYRFVFVFLEDLRRTRLAMACRGYRPRAGLRTLRIAAGHAGALIVNSFERTDRIHHAMINRGFRGGYPSARCFRLQVADVGKGLAVLSITLLLLAGDNWWWDRL